MKFQIKRDHFSNALQQVQNLVSFRPSMPILFNVLLEAEGEYLKLTTTNLDMGIRCKIKGEIIEPGSITLPVKRLASIVKDLPGAEVLVEVNASNQAQLRSGGAKYKIMGLSRDEFPPLPKFDVPALYQFEQNDFERMIHSVAYAQSTSEDRYILNGVHVNFADNNVNLVATDGRRLALISTKVDTVASGTASSFVLPRATVGELERVLGRGKNMKIVFNERQVGFELDVDESESFGLVDSIYLVSKVVEGSYPNYRQVIPQETINRVMIDRQGLLGVIKRASLVISDKNRAVKFKMANNVLEVSASSSEFGEFHEALAIRYEGAEAQMAFNPEYIIQPLSALTKDEVAFEFKDDLSPGVFKTDDNFICVVMPLRIQ